jgi:hypothetical protein
MSEVRQKLIVGIFSSVLIDKSKYCKNKSFQPFFSLIEGSPHHPPQTRAKNDGSGSKSFEEPKKLFQGIDSASLCSLFCRSSPHRLFKNSCTEPGYVNLRSTGIDYQYYTTELVFVDPLRRPEIDSQLGGPVRQPYILYRPARQHRLAASIPGLHKRLQIRALARQAT